MKEIAVQIQRLSRKDLRMTNIQIEKIIETLTNNGHKPECVQHDENKTKLEYDNAYITIYHENLFTEFSVRFDYDLTFDNENVKYLNKKGVKYWSIYKHWLQLNYQPNDENELESTIEVILDTYN